MTSTNGAHPALELVPGPTVANGVVSHSNGMMVSHSNGMMVSHGNVVGGTGLTPVVLSASSDFCAGHMETFSASETAPIYALGPLGPFLVAATANTTSGSCNGGGPNNNPLNKGDESAVAASSITNSGMEMACGGANGAGFAPRGGVMGAGGVTEGVVVSGGSEAGSETQEIVTPPVVGSSEELMAMQKQTDERFRRKSKNLPCTVAGES